MRLLERLVAHANVVLAMKNDLLPQDDGGFSGEEVAFALSHLLASDTDLFRSARKESEIELDEDGEDSRLFQLDRSNVKLDAVESLDLRRRGAVLWLSAAASVLPLELWGESTHVLLEHRPDNLTEMRRVGSREIGNLALANHDSEFWLRSGFVEGRTASLLAGVPTRAQTSKLTGRRKARR